MTDSVTVLVGTTKGAFILSSNERSEWELRGPYCEGAPINHIIGRNGSLWAAGGGEWYPFGVWRSQDRGESWSRSESGLTGDEQPEALWSLARIGDNIYVGTKPAALFVSQDDGQTWTKLSGLTDHPDAATWEPGGAGLVLHSIIGDASDPAKLWVGISAAGVYASEDAGGTWEQRNRLANEEVATSYAEDGHICTCVHNMVHGPGEPGLLYQQNHQGVFRSRDGGRVWNGITEGLPSSFGFPIRVHPRDPQMIWTFPLNGDSAGRFPPDAAAAVWRSSDGGSTWERQARGLPQSDCYMTVLRQAMAVDAQSPCGVYFGTNTGSVFASADEGESWREIARHLPTVLSVEVMEGV